jgi:RNA polymerase sigma-70 factor (ECF subfamily)
MSDDELYNRFLTGDVSSYDDLMIRYGDSMTVYLYGYLHNWHDAEDLMIEAFARILVKKPHIRSGNFKAYLFKTARNLATNFHAVRKRADVFSLEELETELPGGSMPEELLQDTETKRILQICMERIDPMIREALWLVYRENLSYAETAAVMRISSKKVDNLLEKGKKLMREELKKEGISGAYE